MKAKRKKKKHLLIITHNIFLTKDDRYDLANGTSIEAVGVSLPVWFDPKGKTSEPAQEIFCNYVLVNPINPNEHIPVQQTDNGYLITLPQIPEKYKPVRLTDEVFRDMNSEQRSIWYEQHAEPPNGKNLLDIKEGGSEYLKFEEHNQAKIKAPEMKDIYTQIIHCVEIKKIEDLEKSLV